jgi:hypothetical protein
MGKVARHFVPALVLWLVGAAPVLSEQEHPHPFRRLLEEKRVPGQNIGGESCRAVCYRVGHDLLSLSIEAPYDVAQ